MSSNLTGRIAFAMTQKGVVAGVVTERSQGRTMVLTSSGREVWANDRVFFVSAARAPMHSAGAASNAAASFFERVQELVTRVELTALWDLLRDEQGPFCAEELAGLLFGNAEPEHVAAVAVAIAMDDRYFKTCAEGQYCPRTSEAVESMRRKQESEARERERIERAAERIRELLDNHEAFSQDDPVARPAVEWLRTVAVGKADNKARGEAVLTHLFGDRAVEPEVLAFDTLVRLGVFDEDEVLGIHRHRIALEFPAEVLAEAERLAMSRMPESEMADRRMVSIPKGQLGPITIDDPWTLDLDDALMLEDAGDLFRIHIMIADPTAVIPMESLTAAEGMARAATLYLPKGKVPMLPEGLSQDALSLSRNEPRPMLDFECLLTREGHVQSFGIVPIMAAVEHRLSYEEADRLIANPQDCLADTLRRLSELAECLRRNRVAQGAVPIERDEVSVRVENGEIVVRRLPHDSPARRLVAEFMILACTQAGAYARKHGIPVVYRRQAPPEDMRSLEGLIPGTRPWAYRMMRTLKKAELSTLPDLHFGLGVNGYTQVTSPLRRFQDFVTHAQLKGFLRKGKAPLDTGGIVKIFGDLEARGEALVQIEREARRYWLLKYLKRFEGKTVEGEVVAASGSRGIVHLLETGLEIPVAGAGRIALGTQVEVRVHSVEPRRDRVSLSLT